MLAVSLCFQSVSVRSIWKRISTFPQKSNSHFKQKLLTGKTDEQTHTVLHLSSLISPPIFEFPFHVPVSLNDHMQTAFLKTSGKLWFMCIAQDFFFPHSTGSGLVRWNSRAVAVRIFGRKWVSVRWRVFTGLWKQGWMISSSQLFHFARRETKNISPKKQKKQKSNTSLIYIRLHMKST